MTNTVAVPVEPTEEMLEAAYNVDVNGEELPNTYREVYQAMLAGRCRRLRGAP